MECFQNFRIISSVLFLLDSHNFHPAHTTLPTPQSKHTSTPAFRMGMARFDPSSVDGNGPFRSLHSGWEWPFSTPAPLVAGAKRAILQGVKRAISTQSTHAQAHQIAQLSPCPQPKAKALSIPAFRMEMLSFDLCSMNRNGFFQFLHPGWE